MKNKTKSKKLFGVTYDGTETDSNWDSRAEAEERARELVAGGGVDEATVYEMTPLIRLKLGVEVVNV
jgi:hypothetical protein